MVVDPAILQFGGQIITVSSIMTLITQLIKLSPDILKSVKPGNKWMIRAFVTAGNVVLYLVWSYFYSGDVFMVENVIGVALSIAVSTWEYDWILKRPKEVTG